MGPGGGAIGARRGVFGGEGRAVDGVGEAVGEDSAGAGWDQMIERQRTAELEVLLGFVAE